MLFWPAQPCRFYKVCDISLKVAILCNRFRKRQEIQITTACFHITATNIESIKSVIFVAASATITEWLTSNRNDGETIFCNDRKNHIYGNFDNNTDRLIARISRQRELNNTWYFFPFAVSQLTEHLQEVCSDADFNWQFSNRDFDFAFSDSLLIVREQWLWLQLDIRS